MKNIISKQDFLLESLNEYNKIKNQILDIVEYNGEYGMYFSDSFNGYSFVREGEKKFKKFLEILKNKGINIDYFFSKYKNQIYNDTDFTWNNAIIDMLLYKYDKSHLLSGTNANNSTIGDWNEYGSLERTLKYDYGWHTTNLGKKYLFQGYNKLIDFYKDVALEFPIKIIEEQTENINTNYNYKTILDYYTDIIVKDDYAISITNFKKIFDDGILTMKTDKNNQYEFFLKNMNYTSKTFEIKDNHFIEYFGENIKPITLIELKGAKERIKLKKAINKYNL